ncbi:hypothetical protein [Streptomyces sp. NBC_00481]|uniref:hypothetical protein n=1 Tax=Streptomyces sp. NBC_00481 TaxID=2975755 RepID=UPI002DDB97FB|nr:hypothetical protein [Streptomyces sp. NBC_00481]
MDHGRYRAALAQTAGASAPDTTTDGSSTARTLVLPEGAVNFTMGTPVGSYEPVGRGGGKAGPLTHKPIDT